ncbi:MAG: hypothetical protein M3P51_11510 [Chloroflexota bacterium]|nr:hypothetical protein [Chloroflexota bacterium]
MSRIEKATRPAPADLGSRQRDEISHLVAQRNSLVARLETGSRQIEQMRASGESTEQWERFWVRLLHQYEQVCDKLVQQETSEGLRRAS